MRARPAVVISVLAVVVTLTCTGCDGEIVTYKDQEYGFSFRYDDSWRLQESSEDDVPAGASKSVGVFDPRGSHDADNLTYDYFAVSVYALDSASVPTVDELKAGFADYLQQLKASDDTFWVIEHPASAEVNGRPAVTVSYMFTDNDQEVRCNEYRLVDPEGVVYGLYTQTAVAYWDENRELFRIFLDSFSLDESM